MKEVIFKLTQYLADIETPDYERNYVLTAPKNVISECQRIFTEDFKQSDMALDYKQLGVNDISECKITKVYLAGVGFIKFQESDNKEIKLQLK